MPDRDSRFERWNGSYLSGDLPWDTGRLDRNLADTLHDCAIPPCPALDIGCGHGTNAIWLAQQGFAVDAIDLSPKAIEQATANGIAAGVDIRFKAACILNDALPRHDYGFIFDRGCFHSFDDPSDQKAFVRVVHGALTDHGWWLSLIGNADDRERTGGPPKRTARQIVDLVEPLFEIHLLKTSHFDSNEEPAPRSWVCLSKRDRPAHEIAD
ncbi:MAG: methyltransferase domain-containing protein [Lentisphaerae bacterium]|nr:methyltransferase domain-containing protein [Lentisphaerota bacterium]